MNEKEYEKIHEIYLMSKELVEKNLSGFPKNIVYTSDMDERDFIITIRDFFLQKRQRKIIAEECY